MKLQVHFLAYLAYTLSLFTSAPTLTAQDVVDGLSQIRDKLIVLHQRFDAIHSGLSLEDLSLPFIQLKFNEIVGDWDKVTSELKTVQNPFSMADCTKIVDALKDLEPVIEAGTKLMVDKKPVFDSIPCFGCGTAIMKRDVFTVKRTYDDLSDAFLPLAQGQCLDEAQSLRKQADVAYGTAIAAYQ